METTAKRVSRYSDEGYNSDLSSPTRDFTRDELKVINREAKEFKERYFVEELINNSANGVIYKGYRKIDFEPICVKQIPKTRISHWIEHDGRSIPRELEMHLQAQTAFGVVKIFDWYERKTSFVLVMERPPNTKDLFEISREHGAIGEEPAKIIFRQVLETTAELHSLGILHRDIKDENILMNLETLQIKIIDFGCATKYDADIEYSELSGTPEFFAPELLCNNRRYRAESSAVWTLGTLLYVILMGDIPFETTHQIVSDQRQEPEMESHLSLPAQELLNKMMNKYPEERPTIQELLTDEWFQ